MLEMKGQLPPTRTHSVMSEGMRSELRQHPDPQPAGSAPDSQEAISLTLTPGHCGGAGLWVGAARKAQAEQPLPITGKCQLGPCSGCSPGQPTDPAILVLSEHAVAPQAYESPKVLA